VLVKINLLYDYSSLDREFRIEIRNQATDFERTSDSPASLNDNSYTFLVWMYILRPRLRGIGYAWYIKNLGRSLPDFEAAAGRRGRKTSSVPPLNPMTIAPEREASAIWRT
jgi:hypothetical protein